MRAAAVPGAALPRRAPRALPALALALLATACAGGNVLPAPASPLSPPARAKARAPTPRWWRGNLHTHTLWSDGNAFPEQVLQWYRDHGYQFVVLSDHNVIANGERWITLPPGSARRAMAQRYLAAFGDDSARMRLEGDTLLLRLRTLAGCERLFDRPGEFLVVPGEEISDSFAGKPVHVTAIGLGKTVAPAHGSSAREVLERDVAAAERSAASRGEPLIVQVNHPNFYWALTSHELASARGVHFFEVYNGSVRSHNEGDATHPGTSRMWDEALTARLRAGRHILYGVAGDDAHNFRDFRPQVTNPGRAWVMVRAPELSVPALVAALARGDFYASTGVTLRDIRVHGDRIRVEVAASPGVTYTTSFIGTRREGGSPVGQVLARVAGNSAAYRFRGDELYVRAEVVSSRLKPNGLRPGELEMAWTQPLLPPAHAAAPVTAPFSIR